MGAEPFFLLARKTLSIVASLRLRSGFAPTSQKVRLNQMADPNARHKHLVIAGLHKGAELHLQKEEYNTVGLPVSNKSDLREY
jgi:hypothetical protein